MKEGKIWNIHYEMENLVFTDPKAMEGFKMLGVDFANEKFAQKVFIQMMEFDLCKLNCVGEAICSKVWRGNGKVGK